MGRFDGPEIPVLRLELEGIKYNVLTMLEIKHGELKLALERGIDLAYKQLPVIVAERVREGIVEAATRATDTAMKEYFGPGGAGYEKIIQQVIAYVEGQEVGPRVNTRDRYIIGGEDAEQAGMAFGSRGQDLTLEEALQRLASEGLFIWRVSEGEPWMKMYWWNLGIWSVVPRERR